MKNALFAVLAFAIPFAASAAPNRLPDQRRVERPRPEYQQTNVRLNDQVRSNSTKLNEKMPEVVKQMIKYDLCSTAVANCE